MEVKPVHVTASGRKTISATEQKLTLAERHSAAWERLVNLPDKEVTQGLLVPIEIPEDLEKEFSEIHRLEAEERASKDAEREEALAHSLNQNRYPDIDISNWTDAECLSLGPGDMRFIQNILRARSLLLECVTESVLDEKAYAEIRGLFKTFERAVNDLTAYRYPVPLHKTVLRISENKVGFVERYNQLRFEAATQADHIMVECLCSCTFIIDQMDTASRSRRAELAALSRNAYYIRCTLEAGGLMPEKENLLRRRHLSLLLELRMAIEKLAYDFASASNKVVVIHDEIVASRNKPRKRSRKSKKPENGMIVPLESGVADGKDNKGENDVVRSEMSKRRDMHKTA